MTELAVQATPAAPPMQLRQLNAIETAAMTLDSLWWLAQRVADGKLFPGLTNDAAVFTLMCICQSEGLHPIEALRQYDIVEGRPAMKAAAIQAKFLSRGGRIKILVRTNEEARAVFTHPQLCPDGWENSVSFADLQKRGITNGRDGVKTNYKRSPAEMLWARLVSNSIRTIDPGIVVGITSSEELRDELDNDRDVRFALPMQTAPVEISATSEAVTSQTLEARLPGQDAPGPDSRTYADAVNSAIVATNRQIEELAQVNGVEVPLKIAKPSPHKFLFNQLIQNALHPGPMPTKLGDAIVQLDQAYKARRDWVRITLGAFFAEQMEEAQAIVAKQVRERGEKEAPKTAEPKTEAADAAPNQGSLLDLNDDVRGEGPDDV